MKITVIVPSRGRVLPLMTVLMCLDRLATRNHEITYVVPCDNDNQETRLFCEKLKGFFYSGPLIPVEGPRPRSLGRLVNQMAEKFPADAYTALCDDLIVCWPAWDDVIAKAVEKTPHGVFWWKNAFPVDATYAIVTEKWRAAAGGIFTDNYPYWFDDLHLLELWMLTTDEGFITLDCILHDRPTGETLRMRELEWWVDFFRKTRPLRIKKAFDTAEKLGLPAPQKTGMIQKRISFGLERMGSDYLKETEAKQGDKRPVTASYLDAKKRAQAILDDMQRSGDGEKYLSGRDSV